MRIISRINSYAKPGEGFWPGLILAEGAGQAIVEKAKSYKGRVGSRDITAARRASDMERM